MGFSILRRTVAAAMFFICTGLCASGQEYDEIVVFLQPNVQKVDRNTAINKACYSDPMVFSKISKATNILMATANDNTGMYIGTSTASGVIQFEVLPAYQSGVRKIVVSAIQYYGKDSSGEATAAVEASLSVNDSESQKIVSADSRQENSYTFIMDPEVPLTGVKLTTDRRIIGLRLTLVYKEENTAGIKEIGADVREMPVNAEIYTLDGLRVSPEDLKAGLYIMRHGNRSRKILVR